MKSSTKFKRLVKDEIENADIRAQQGSFPPGYPSTYEAVILEGISLILKELEKRKI